VPSEAEARDGESKTEPASHVVLRSRDVVAFLDILPMTRGHLLVCSREHRGKVEGLRGRESREIGEFFCSCVWGGD
jgi:diadenosine tetraphosphate (Ap4A) HIT family hydrolase